MDKVIDNIHELFIEEARKSPLLFNDLASMENYISESYSGRSLIELLQNADDAQSEKLLVKKQSDFVFIVANDGRAFTGEDILALCRSGASTKKRNADTIGYRGIGFKSIVNYANVVHLYSGKIHTTFSRELTKKELANADKIPLIRVPHAFSGQRYMADIKELLEMGYTTVFVFEVSSKAILKEMQEFSEDSLIFLKYIKKVEILSDLVKSYEIERNCLDKLKQIIEVKNMERRDKKLWLIIENKDKLGKTSLAFKFDGKKVIAAEKSESVIHSFLPTNDKMCIRCKINGDFSTDPSRTRIVQDKATEIANQKCAELVANIFEDILLKGNDEYNLIDILKEAAIDPLATIKGESPSDIIIRLLLSEVRKKLIGYTNGKRVLLQPKGMENIDFEKIVEKHNSYGIGNIQEQKIPGIIEFLKCVGVEELSLNDSLEVMQELVCSDRTRAITIQKAIKETQLGMTEEQKELLTKAKLFKFEDGVKSVQESKGSKIEDFFEGTITENLTTDVDYTSFAKKIGLDKDQLALYNQGKDFEHKVSNSKMSTSVEKFHNGRKIKKWRSVEKNVKAVLELLDNVVCVTDVSEQNIGYDLEAVFSDGTRRFYEVKSVGKLGEQISFSNNEYSTCVSLKDSYYLAIAAETNYNIEVCFVKNPVEKLHFEKRVTRWDWLCGEYEGEVIDTKME